MYMLTFSVGGDPSDEYRVIVAFERHNLERMRDNDPAVVSLEELGSRCHGKICRVVYFVTPSDADLLTVQAMIIAGRPDQAIQFLMRGISDDENSGGGGDTSTLYELSHWTKAGLN